MARPQMLRERRRHSYRNAGYTRVTSARSHGLTVRLRWPVDATLAVKPPAKTAWTQGTNPLTQRPTSTATSNGAVNSPKPSQTSPASSGETPTPMRHLSDRMMYLLANLTGLPGIITLKNGEKYSGVLSGTSLDPSELRYVFKMVKKLMPATSAQTNGAAEASEDYVGKGDYHVMSFDMSDVADFNVNNVVLDKSQAKTQNGMSRLTSLFDNIAVTDRHRHLRFPYRH
ncbi:SM-ATX domain containing protein [Pyrenophora tritici-repentis]|nr:SM-ATX domain containing protein [Pyrenophora tritici-repentis]KAI1537712.1 SM-ATX domain containing protein [Pyrenophora tritici-repentis]